MWWGQNLDKYEIWSHPYKNLPSRRWHLPGREGFGLPFGEGTFFVWMHLPEGICWNLRGRAILLGLAPGQLLDWGLRTSWYLCRRWRTNTGHGHESDKPWTNIWFWSNICSATHSTGALTTPACILKARDISPLSFVFRGRRDLYRFCPHNSVPSVGYGWAVGHGPFLTNKCPILTSEVCPISVQLQCCQPVDKKFDIT